MATEVQPTSADLAILEAYGPPRVPPKDAKSGGNRAKSAARTTPDTAESDPQASEEQTPEQAALRGLSISTGGDNLRDRLAFIDTLAQEWAAGTMPRSRQEQVVILSCWLPQQWHSAHERDNKTLQDKGQPPIAQSLTRVAELEALCELSASILASPQASAFGWNRPLLIAANQFHREPGVPLPDHLSSHLRASKGHGNLTRWLLGAQSKPLRARLKEKGGARPALLGPDALRPLFMECQPVSGYGNTAMPFHQVKRGMEYFGLSALSAPSKSNATPLLELALNAFSVATPTDAVLWAQLLAQADTLPFFQFDHQKAIWRAPHPLWSLASSLRADTQRLDVLPIVEAFLRMGYKANGEIPQGRGAATSSEADLFAKKAPNALWAFCLCERPPVHMTGLIHALTADGADPRSVATDPMHPGRPARPLLAAINARAHSTSMGGEDSPLSNAFEALVGLGLDPLDALPPRSLSDAAPGRIREVLSARMEREALMHSLSEQDMAEALLLLQQKRETERELRAPSTAIATPRRSSRL